MIAQSVIAKGECVTMKDLFLKKEDNFCVFEKRAGKSFFNYTLLCSIRNYNWAG